MCKVMGWTLDELLDLPIDVYAVLVEELAKAAD
jgi:hypothetical protein